MKASLGLGAIGALVVIGAALAMKESAHLALLPVIASQAFAWGVGTTLAVAAAMRVFPLDVEQGVVALVRARGVGASAYAAARVAGLVGVLAAVVAGGALVAGLAATAVATSGAGDVARAGGAAIVFGLAFAVTLGPLSMATLGAGTRGGGYAWLLLVLVVPELLAPWTQGLLPAGWKELTSIPAALEAVRSSVQNAGAALAHGLRAAIGLAGVAAASLLVIRARVPGDAPGQA
ncbi:MAG TPA: hypothetical protein VHV30_08785 [Polyangiaceae bacterium]|nr:hypothetical protein [Polyangiaceae bacterium]